MGIFLLLFYENFVQYQPLLKVDIYMKNSFIEKGDKVMDGMGAVCFALVVLGSIWAAYDTIARPITKTTSTKIQCQHFQR